jgi:hypothetical protein
MGNENSSARGGENRWNECDPNKSYHDHVRHSMGHSGNALLKDLSGGLLSVDKWAHPKSAPWNSDHDRDRAEHHRQCAISKLGK